MKKSLLLISFAALAASASAEWTTVSPAGYNFERSGQYQITNAYYATPGANIAVKDGNVWNEVSEYWDDNAGLLAVVCNNVQPLVTEAVKNGASILDLGGTAGHVFCMVGNSLGETVNNAFKEYDENITVPVMEKATPFGSLNFFLAPASTKFSADGHLRLTMTCNVLYGAAAKFDISICDNFNSGNFVTLGNLEPEHHVGHIEGASTNKADGEWNPEKWGVYEAEWALPTVNTPFRLKINFGGGGAINNMALLIRDIKLEYSDDPADWGTSARSVAAAPQVTPTLYTIAKAGVVTGIENVAAEAEELKVNVDGSCVSFSADAVVYSTSGQQVAIMSAGTVRNLAPGIYIAAAQNGKNIKFAVR